MKDIKFIYNVDAKNAAEPKYLFRSSREGDLLIKSEEPKPLRIPE